MIFLNERLLLLFALNLFQCFGSKWARGGDRFLTSYLRSVMKLKTYILLRQHIPNILMKTFFQNIVANNLYLIKYKHIKFLSNWCEKPFTAYFFQCHVAK